MLKLRAASVDEVLESWVRGELHSDRFGDRYRAALREHPEASPAELLAAVRGWPDRGYFEAFPQDVAWSLARLERQEMTEVLYINWDYWLDVSGGTRRPADAVARMGWEEWLVPAPETEPLILVSDTNQSRLVVLEGHARLTRYVIAGPRLPDVACYLGQSPSMGRWPSF